MSLSSSSTSREPCTTHENLAAITEEEFVERLLDAIHKGYRVLPFIGAGLSQQSGIATVKELRRYLTYCVWLLLGGPYNGKAQATDQPLWQPRSSSWPQIGLEHPFENPKGLWETADLNSQIQQFFLNLKHESERSTVWEAYGALADWRTTLRFLSRITGARYHFGKLELKLSIPDDSIIDSFFFNQVTGKEPNLGHRLLIALLPFFRANLIFTTNFDDLLEKAFALTGTPFTSFEMPEPTNFPSARVVLKSTALLKLHGGRFGLRTDYSIDAHPSRSDRWNFVSYLAGYPVQVDSEQLPESQFRGKNRLREKVALFVSGVSANDKKTRALIKLACSTFTNLRVFWLCFSRDDVDSVNTIADECLPDGKGARFAPCRSTDQPLVMLRLYQRCTISVPTSGMFYPALWNVRSHPVIAQSEEFRKRIARYGGELKKAVGSRLQEQSEGNNENEKANSPVVISIPENVYGGVTLCSHLCDVNEWSAKYKTRSIWINLDEVVRPVGVILRLVLHVARHFGVQDPMSSLDLDAFDLGKPSQFDSFQAHVKRIIAEATARLGGRWVVFLNGQEGIGNEPIFSPGPNERPWEDDWALERLAKLLEELTKSSDTGMCFVLLIRKGNETPEKFFSKRWRPEIEITENLTRFNQKEVLRNALSLSTGKIPDWFLYLLTLFRTARFSASLSRISCRYALQTSKNFSSQIRKTWLVEMADKVEGWVKTLEENGVVRFLPGGLIWMNQTLRRKLQEALRSKLAFESRLKLGALVSRWQGRLLLASSDPLAAWECGVCALETVADSIDSFANSRSNLARACQILRHFQQVLHTGRKLLLLRLSNNFADRALWDLESRLAPLKNRDTEIPRVLSEIVASVQAEIRRLRIWLYLQEGEYQRVRKLTSATELTALQPYQQTEARLHLSAALLCQRDYEKANGEIESAFERLGLTIDRHLFKDPEGAARLWLLKNENLENRPNLILASRRMCYLKLHISQADFLEPNNSKKERWKKRSRTLREAIVWAIFGLAILRSIERTNSNYVFVQNVRLRAHMALAMALQEVSDRKGALKGVSRLANSQAVMGDAQAYLEEFPLPESGLDVTILELRKAEIELIRLGTANWFKRLRKAVQSWPKEIPHQNFRPSELAAGKGQLLDAFARLNRAEEILRLHRKNRWWWWLFTTLKMKACEYFFVLRMGWLLLERNRERYLIYSQHTVPPFVRSFCRSDLKELVDEHRCNDVFLLARIVRSYTMTMCAMIAYRDISEKQIEPGRPIEPSSSNWWTRADKWRALDEYLLARLKGELDHRGKQGVYSAVRDYALDCHKNGVTGLQDAKKFLSPRRPAHHRKEAASDVVRFVFSQSSPIGEALARRQQEVGMPLDSSTTTGLTATPLPESNTRAKGM